MPRAGRSLASPPGPYFLNRGGSLTVDDPVADALLRRLFLPELARYCQVTVLRPVAADSLELTVRLPAQIAADIPWNGGSRAGSLEPRRRRVRIGRSLWLVQDTVKKKVWLGDEELSLSPLHYRLLNCFLASPDHVLSAEELTRAVWDRQCVASRQPLDRLLTRLRDDQPVIAARIRNVLGRGWCFEPYSDVRSAAQVPGKRARRASSSPG